VLPERALVPRRLAGCGGSIGFGGCCCGGCGGEGVAAAQDDRGDGGDDAGESHGPHPGAVGAVAQDPVEGQLPGSGQCQGRSGHTEHRWILQTAVVGEEPLGGWPMKVESAQQAVRGLGVGSSRPRPHREVRRGAGGGPTPMTSSAGSRTASESATEEPSSSRMERRTVWRLRASVVAHAAEQWSLRRTPGHSAGNPRGGSSHRAA